MPLHILVLILSLSGKYFQAAFATTAWQVVYGHFSTSIDASFATDLAHLPKMSVEAAAIPVNMDTCFMVQTSLVFLPFENGQMDK